jgi:hypothetical protein
VEILSRVAATAVASETVLSLNPVDEATKLPTLFEPPKELGSQKDN